MNEDQILLKIREAKRQEETRLDLSFCQIEELPVEIGELRNLRWLNLSSNRLRDLPSQISDLEYLESLDLRNNNLTDLPYELGQLDFLQQLDLRGNPINIPVEILSNSTDPFVILSVLFGETPDITWVKEIRRKRKKIPKRRPLMEAKVILVGQGGVGKTSLINRLLNRPFNPKESKTEGIFINKWKTLDTHNLNESKKYIRLNIWDFGGQEIMHATHQFFLTERSLYVLVIDARLEQEENRIEYWLKMINSFGGKSPVILVGNKIDQQPLSIDQKGLKFKFPNIKAIIETSCEDDRGIHTLRSVLTREVSSLPHIHDELPETWFKIKRNLEGLKKDFISTSEYEEMCKNLKVNDKSSRETLIGFLHDLGVVIHFKDDPRLLELGILNPQWVTNGVYKIINSHSVLRNKGVLHFTLLDEILDSPEYPQNKRIFIIDMMKKFELCYDIGVDKVFLVPDLLPKDEPEYTFEGIPAFEYTYPVLPSSVITRFIVRMNQKIDDGMVWRTGVVLKIGENKALVRADIEDRKITIAIDGQEHTRRDALSAIRYQLDEIHGSIKGLDVQKRVPISEAPEAEPLDYDYLLQLERDGFEEHPVKNGNRLVVINVRKLLSGVENEMDRKQNANNVTKVYVAGDVKADTFIAGNENQATVSKSDKKPKKKNP